MSTKVFVEILTEDDSSSALSKVSALLGDYKISSIKASPSSTLRADSKNKVSLDDFSDFSDINDPNQLQKAIKEKRFSELKTNNDKRLDSLKNAENAKEISADQAILNAKKQQAERIENANKY